MIVLGSLWLRTDEVIDPVDVPGFAIMLAVLASTSSVTGLCDALDPRLRGAA